MEENILELLDRCKLNSNELSNAMNFVTIKVLAQCAPLAKIHLKN